MTHVIRINANSYHKIATSRNVRVIGGFSVATAYPPNPASGGGFLGRRSAILLTIHHSRTVLAHLQRTSLHPSTACGRSIGSADLSQRRTRPGPCVRKLLSVVGNQITDNYICSLFMPADCVENASSFVVFRLCCRVDLVSFTTCL